MTGPRVLEKYNKCGYETIHKIISSEIRIEQDISSYWTSSLREVQERVEVLLGKSATFGVYQEEKTLNNINSGNKISERVAVHADNIMCLGNSIRQPLVISFLLRKL